MIAPRPDQQFGTNTLRIAVTFTGTIYLNKRTEEGEHVKGSTMLLARSDRERMRRALDEADVQDALWREDNGY